MPGGAGPVQFDTRRRYLVCVSKNYGHVRVSLVDIDASAFSSTTLLDANLGAHESVLLSNMEVKVNAAGNWNANAMAFGTLARETGEADLAALYAHYRKLLQQFDPAFVQLSHQLGEAQRLRACPYDQATCTACASVKDWTSNEQVLGAGQACLKAIDAFCTKNPTHVRCACWDASRPDPTGACKAYRTVYSGLPAAVCGGASSSKAPAAPPTPTEQAVDRLLSAKNVDALVRIAGAMRPPVPAPAAPPAPAPAAAKCPRRKQRTPERAGFWHWLFASDASRRRGQGGDDSDDSGDDDAR